MSAKKHKRKTAQRTHHHGKAHSATSSLLNRYPRLFLATGSLLVFIAILLLTIGYVSHARVGLSMIALFFGVALLIFANAAMPKKTASR